MKKRIKQLLIPFMLLATIFFVTACAGETNMYEQNDARGYNVSIRYDANGGEFTTGTTVIVDSYTTEGLKTDSDGKVQIALLPTDDENRTDKFTPRRNGYFLAGWYSQRTESTDSEGNTVYTYANKWDFKNDRYSIDPSKTYTATEPVMTLYACWIPMFEINFYNVSDGSLIENVKYNPMSEGALEVPAWNTSTGTMDMKDFPKRDGYTFAGAYMDKEATQPIVDILEHTGKVNEADGTAVNPVMNVYVDWTEGEWFHIYNVEQFQKNARLNGHYIIHNDLNFKNEDGSNAFWPTVFQHGSFTGSIQGVDGKVIKIENVNVNQNNNSKINTGLFGSVSSGAMLSGIEFNNITVTVEKGSRMMDASFGLLAGSLADDAILANIRILNSTLQIDMKAQLKVEGGVPQYALGKVCGIGYESHSDIDYSGITAQFIGEGNKILIDNGNELVVQNKATEE